MTAQGVIDESAIKKAEEAGPNGIGRFMVAMSEPFFTHDELEFLRTELGMVGHMHTCRWASVEIPARNLLLLSEMPSVIRVG